MSSCRATNAKAYGARGITVCDRWLMFENFLADMGERPAGTTLDRIDNAKGYGPDNCRWATQTEQHRNKRSNVHVEALGVRKCIAEWSELTKVPESTIRSRLARGVAPEVALGFAATRGKGE